MNRKNLIRLGTWMISIIAVVVLARCALEPVTGGGTEGGNVVAGIFVDEKGNASAKVVVHLVPSDYNPGATEEENRVVTTRTANDGGYSFDHVLAGNYSIEAIDTSNNKQSLMTGIVVSEVNITQSTDTLRVPGTLRIKPPAANKDGYLYMPGTTILARIDTNTGYMAIDVPSTTTLPPLCYGESNALETVVLRYDLQIASGDTAVVAYPGWKYARRLYLNTTAAGADISGDVAGFPIIIRLTGSNFDFTQAKIDGSDIRFTKSDTTRLPYEIERWDPTAELAEAWVRVDTIYGNDNTQFIAVYWGNTHAADSSNGMAVFDATNGFEGVWHLGDVAEDSTCDATANRYHGVSPNTARPQIAEGVAGNCRAFDGITDFITMPNTADGKLNFPEGADYTVSAWVFLDTIDNREQAVVVKGGTQYFLMLTYVPSDSPLWDFAEFNENEGWQASFAPATNKSWTLLTGVCRGNSKFIYSNGVLVDSVPTIYSADNYSRNTSNDLTIGRFLEAVNGPNENNDDSYCFFKGSIDEVRITSAARSPDWVRLCYMNQQADDRLVVFK